MSQLIACKTPAGIALGADGKAVDVDANGNLIELKVARLHQLSRYAAILNGGAAAGEGMCRDLKNFISEERLTYVDEIHRAALPFMATEYDRFMRKHCEVQPIDPVHQVNFILAGYNRPQDKENPFKIYLLWTKRKLPLLDSDEIGTAFSVPRIIRLEYELHRLAARNESLEGVMSAVRRGLETQVDQNSDVSEPLQLAAIYENGFKGL